VGDGAICYENAGTKPEVEREYRAVFGMDIPENLVKL